VLHPHLHCLITAGGVTPEGQWREAKRSFLFPSRAVSVVFRGKVLAAVRRAVAAGRLQFPPDLTGPKVHTRLNKLGRKKWNVHIRERYPHGRGVLTDLSRYLRGGPLAERRLLTATAQAVTFWYTDNQDLDAKGRGTRKTLTVSTEEFLTRLLTHVPSPGLQVVRSYGLFATAARPALATCRALLEGQEAAAAPAAPPPQSATPRPCPVLVPRTCPQCGRALIRRESFGPGALRSPPRSVVRPEVLSPAGTCSCPAPAVVYPPRAEAEPSQGVHQAKSYPLGPLCSAPVSWLPGRGLCRSSGPLAHCLQSP
jgi:hypothetical protein